MAQNDNRFQLKNLSATEQLKLLYIKYNETYEITNKNDNVIVKNFNASFKINLYSAYCGTSLYSICREANFQLDIPKNQAPMARAWGNYGEVIWTKYSGWKVGTNKKPNKNEIFVVIFTNGNGSFHVGVILDYHGTLDFITGEGNTSDWRVRRKEFLYYNNTINKNPNIYLPRLKKQGIYAGKERYSSGSLFRIIKYVVQ